MKLFQNNTLQKKLTIMFALLVTIPCIIICLIMYKYQEGKLKTENMSQYSKSLGYIEQSISRNMAHIEGVIDVYSNSETLKRLFGENGMKTDFIVNLIFDVIEEKSLCLAYLSDYNPEITILSQKEDVLERSNTFVRQSRYSGDTELMDFINSTRKSCWTQPKTGKANTFNIYSSYDRTVIPYYQKIYSRIGEYIGTIQCSVQLEKLFAPVNDLLDEGTVMVWIYDDCVMRVDKESVIINPQDELVQLQDKYTRYTNGYINDFYQVSIDVPNDKLNDRLIGVLALIICTSIFLYAFILIMTRLLTNLILKRLYFAVNAMTSINIKQRNIQIPNTGEDEISDIIMSFNKLLKHIDLQYEELLKKEKDKRQFQSLSLQYQMNPHFLFNSLSWLQLKIEDLNMDSFVPKAISSLSEVYRYNLSFRKDATLEEEFKHVRAYVLFMQSMKENKISLTVNYDETQRLIKIPRFVLQPIIENAIKHGMEKGKEFYIIIDVQRENGYLKISVCNNGKRIPEERLQHINNDLIKGNLAEDTENIGLKNLALRLNLLYGEQAQIIMSSDDNITCVKLDIPIITYNERDRQEANGV